MDGRDVQQSYKREFSDHDGGIPEVYQPQASAYQWPGQLSDHQSSQNVTMWPTNQFIQGTSSRGFLLGSQPPTPAYHHNIEQSPTFSQNPYLIPGHQNFVESSAFISPFVNQTFTPIGQQPSWSTQEQQIPIQGPQYWNAPFQPFPHSNTEFTQPVSMPIYSEPRVERQPIGTTQFIGKQSKLQGSDWSVQVLGTVHCGTEPGQFNEPYGVAWQGDRLLVCDTNNHRIQILNKNNVVIGIVRFDGQFPQPFKPVSITISPQGCPIIADTGNQQIIVCNENVDIIQTIPQTADVDLRSITVNGRCVYGCDWNGYAVLKYNIEDGKVMANVRGQFGWPHTAVATANNHVLVSDYKKHAIHVLDPDLNLHASHCSKGTDNGQVQCPRGIDVDSHGNVYICDYRNHRIAKFGSDWRFVCNLFEGDVSWPFQIAINNVNTTSIAVTPGFSGKSYHQLRVYTLPT